MGKKQEDYTIHNVFHNIPKFIRDSLDSNQESLFTNNLVYLRKIANAMTYNKVSGKSFLNTFSEKPFYEYSPQEINKAVADALQAPDISQVDTSTQLALLQQHQDSPLFKYDVSHIENDIQRSEKFIKDYQYNIDGYNKNIQTYLEKIGHEVKRIDELNRTLSSIDIDGYNKIYTDEIKAVIDSGKWLYLGSYDNKMLTEDVPHMLLRSSYNNVYDFADKGSRPLFGHLFLATEPTVCAHLSRDSKAIKRAEFGHVLVCLDTTGAVKQAFFALNAYCSIYTALHPHISSEGSICWGNAGSAYTTMVKDSKPNYLNILTLFTSLMETYCPDNPYQRIDTYMDKNVVKRHPILLDTKGVSLIPQDFLYSVVNEDELADYYVVQEYKDFLASYMRELAFDNIGKRQEDLPQGLQHKIKELGISTEDAFNETLNNGTNYTDISVFDLIPSTTFDDKEWELLENLKLNFTTRSKTLIFLAAYSRFLTTGKNMTFYRDGVFFEFTDEFKNEFVWDDGAFQHFAVTTKTLSTSSKKTINHPDQVSTMVMSVDKFRSLK